MFNCNLIVLSYHKFTERENSYEFSRTYKQFEQDIKTKTFDLITIDDGRRCQLKALNILRKNNIRAKIFVTTSQIGKPGYLGWNDLKEIAKFHDVENHSHFHVRLPELDQDHINFNIKTASTLIEKCTGIAPRYFVPPYNKSSRIVNAVAEKYGMQLINNRINITNLTD